MQKGMFLKYTALTIFVALCLFTVKCTEDSSPVITLNSSNFETEVAKYEYLLLEFYAPWCGHCKSLEPEYKKAAEILLNENSSIRLAKIDANENTEIANLYEVKGYPTIKFLKNGERIEYNGGRTAVEIVQWLKKKTGPSSVQLDTVADVEKFKTNSDYVFVYFGREDSETFKSFIALSDKYEYFFAHSFDEAVKSFYNVQDNVVLFKNFDELRNDFQGELSQKAFENFSDIYSVPLLGTVTDRHIEVIFDKNRIGLFYLRSQSSEKDVAFDAVLRNIAPLYKEQIIFVVSDIEGDLEEHVSNYFGVRDENLPQIRISNVIDEEEVKHYVLDKPINEANVEEFLIKFLKGELQQHHKSEAVPVEQDDNAYQLVGSTFKDFVMNPYKHVVVEFYAPWCGHCKKFGPIYEEIAEIFKNEGPYVVLAKMDATENEVEGEIIASFPTIKLYKIEQKSKPIIYEGNREKLDLIQWIRENTDPTYVKPAQNVSDEVPVEEGHSEKQRKEDL